MKKREIAAFFTVLVVITVVMAAGSRAGTISFVNPEVTSGTNIHFNKQFCTECHLHNPEESLKTDLRFDTFTATCRCHGYTPKNYVHPMGIELSPDKKNNIPQGYPLPGGKISCNTCHDLTLQCDPTESATRNKNFLRINPFMPRSGICYQCHNVSGYRRLSPHQQLDRFGNIIKAKCLYCHKMKPDEKHATLKKQRSGQAGTVEFVAEFNTLCFRCHYRQTRMHITNTNHLKPPPSRIITNIENSEKELNVILPRDNNLAVACPTCHNPHQKGVIPAGRPGAAGAGEQSRLRVPRLGNKICQSCHNN